MLKVIIKNFTIQTKRNSDQKRKKKKGFHANEVAFILISMKSIVSNSLSEYRNPRPFCIRNPGDPRWMGELATVRVVKDHLEANLLITLFTLFFNTVSSCKDLFDKKMWLKTTDLFIQSAFTSSLIMHSKRRYKMCACSVIPGELESFRNYKDFSIIFRKILLAI